MKWYLNELDKYTDEKMHFKYELDLTEELKHDEDILRIDPTTVKGNFIKDGDVYCFNFKIETTIYLQCAISLQEVPFEINEWFTEEYSYDSFTGFNIIDKEYLSLEEMVVANIELVKPMRVVAPGVTYTEEEEEYINPAFAGLKNLNGGK